MDPKTLPTGNHHIGNLSRILLDHGGLMTPVLTAFFGSILARPTVMVVRTTTVIRRSTLHCETDDEMILEAKLKIAKACIPNSMLSQLQHSFTPFGQLLADDGLKTKIARREIYCREHNDSAKTRWGRRHIILNATDDSRICDVDELLATEAQLAMVAEASTKRRDNV